MEKKKRNPILSFILSLFVSGLGQVYNGQLKKGLIYFLILFPIYILIGITGLLSFFWGYIILVLIILIYKLLVSVEAFRTSLKLSDYLLKPINKTWKYALFALFGYMFMWYGTMQGRILIGYETFKIPTSSMEPSIEIGDIVMATEIDPHNIQLGDIITFTREDGQTYMGRVVGLPDQKVEIINDKVKINGQIEKWTKAKVLANEDFRYVDYQSKLPTGRTYMVKKIMEFKGREYPLRETSNMKSTRIPADEVFIMGDNRNNSLDSRFYGTISYTDISKKVIYICWSSDKSRIGMELSQ